MRVTQKQFNGAIETLASILGKPLTTNQWHKHYSVYTLGENGSCQTLIAQSNTMRDCLDQVYAATRAVQLIKGES